MLIRGIGFALAVATGALSGLRTAGAFSPSTGTSRAATRRASSSASVAAGGGRSDDGGPTADAAPPSAATASTAAAATESVDPLLPPLRDGLRRASVAVSAATSDGVFDATPSLARLRKRVRQSTDVGPSSLGGHAGLGLFATKNVKAGTVVGLYPAHALGCEVGETSAFVTGNAEDAAYFEGRPHATSPYLHATDQPIFRRPSLLSPLFDESEGTTPPPPLYLDVNPHRNEELDDIWTSHYINDGASLLDVRAGGASAEEGIERYYAESARRKNCVHVPFGPSPVLATVTTKKVKKGQELFTSYGAVYWLGAVDDEPGSGGGGSTLGMMEKIQSQIVQSARDLQKAMEDARRGYATEMADLEKALGDL